MTGSRGRDFSRTSRTALVIAFTLACGFVPRKIAYSDSRVQELLRARARVDAAALGFTTPLPTAEYRLEGRGKGYDAMLHVYGPTSRTIAFSRSGDNFTWVGEQELHTGPREFDTPDGKQHEMIVITYETRPISGAPLNQLYITYTGPDQRLSTSILPGNLTLQQVEPVLAQWQAATHREASK